jgi:hypothetical protein
MPGKSFCLSRADGQCVAVSIVMHAGEGRTQTMTSCWRRALAPTAGQARPAPLALRPPAKPQRPEPRDRIPAWIDITRLRITSTGAGLISTGRGDAMKVQTAPNPIYELTEAF